MKVNIYNQCIGFKLMNQECFSNSLDQYQNFLRQVDAGSMMVVDFGPSLPVFECVLTYEVRRKYVKSNEEINLTHIQLFVVWKSEGYGKLRAYVNLAEYDERFHWNKIKLEEYYQRYVNQLYTYTGPIKDTWLTCDGTVLMTELELDFTQRDGVLSVTISEGIRDEYTRRPELINLERYVPFEPKDSLMRHTNVSFSFDKEALNITILNLYPSLELASPVYYSNGTACHVSPSQQIGASTITEASFGIRCGHVLKGALLYKLQRKHTTRAGNLSNNSTTSIKDTATNMYLLVIWDIENVQYNSFCVCLMEWSNDFTWNEDKLWALYDQYSQRICYMYGRSTITWLMNDGTLMRTKLNVTYRSDYKLNIIISEGTGKYNMEESFKIEPEGLVSLLFILIVLMYAVRFIIRPAAELNIHNQCLNIDLVSPMYITSGWLEFHRQPDYKVYAGDTMKSAFIIRSNRTADGALIYRLQRRQSHESNEISKNTTHATYLLVFWRVFRFRNIFTDVLLVEHDKKLDWNEDDLEAFYSKNFGQFRLTFDSVTETWSLSDNVALMTAFRGVSGNCILNIIISEVKRDNSVRIPARIDLKR
jgi:hypothetical protein